jgi:hypothetical protein
VLKRLAELDAVIAGGLPATPAPAEIPPDWRPAPLALRLDRPETEERLLTELPDATDALLASGRPEAALGHLLDTDWIDAVERGEPPPRMKLIGERLYGAEGYRLRLQDALAAIRVERRPGGRYAAIPLFGRWRPLPMERDDTPDPAATDPIVELRARAAGLLFPRPLMREREIGCIDID